LSSLSVLNEAALEKLADKLSMPPNFREVISIAEPIVESPPSFLPKGYQVGDFVLFSAVGASSSLTEVPIKTASKPAKLEGISSRRLRGIVVKIDTNATTAVSAAASSLASLRLSHRASLRTCEIRVVDADTLAASSAVALASAAQLPSSSCYYCDVAEVRITHTDNGEPIVLAESSSNLAVKIGDVVEFFAVDIETPFWSESITGLAIYPNVVPRSSIGCTVGGVSNCYYDYDYYCYDYYCYYCEY
jgi:hypothetical protein